MTRWRFHAGVLVVAVIASTPPAAAAPDCLAYLAADRSFHEKRAANGPIFRAVGDALEAQDEDGLHALEVRDESRWKAFIESWRKSNQASWKAVYAEAKAAYAKTTVAHDAALAARDAAYKEAWGYDAAAARLVAAYVETYAASGRVVVPCCSRRSLGWRWQLLPWTPQACFQWWVGLSVGT